jgi:hypothetical protein
MILINDPILVNGKGYTLQVVAIPDDGIEPKGEDVHRMLDRIGEAIEVYQNQIEDEI